MKNRFFIIALMALSLVACTDGLQKSIDELEDKYAELEGRVSRLEELCKEMNTNISSLKTLVSVILNNDYIVSVAPITKEGAEVGYTITFAIHDPITIYHGQNGTDGKDGQDGKDGVTPVIGVALDTSDNAYYWTLNGSWLLDADGNRIPLSSRDGKDGQDGQDGQDGKDGQDGQDGHDGADGITPQLKIQDNYWYVSTDNGATWTKLGKATGEDGKDGKDGQDGKDGKDGVGGDSMFQSVTQDDKNVYFTLANGTTLAVPKASDFNQTVIDNLVNELTVDITEWTFSAIGETKSITTTTSPFPNSKVLWESSDPTIVSVNDGLLTANGTGVAIITIKAGDKTATIKTYVQIGAGTLKGVFSISATKKVKFSQGRLQYNPSLGSHLCADGTYKQGTWRFAGTQYETSNTLCENADYDGWNDIFYFGTSGYGSYVPYGTTSSSSDLTDNTDWGRYNAISNGDNIPDLWRCLSDNEWDYLLNSRESASQLVGIGFVNSVKGIILLPDKSTVPSSIQFVPNQHNYKTTDNNFTTSQWSTLEQIGAVFIPSSGTFSGNISGFNTDWTSNKGSLRWTSSSTYQGISCSVVNATNAVRLVKDVE